MIHTNSLESLQHNIQNTNQTLLCELDCSKLKDSYIIAHDRFEIHYGLNDSFDKFSINECKNIKLFGKYTPLFFSELYKFIKDNSFNVNFIIDSKSDLCDDFINHIITNMKEHTDKIVLQVYNKSDILLVEKYKLKCLFALWKYNWCSYNNEIEKNLIYIKDKNINCIGLSLFYKYYENDPKQNINSLVNHSFKIYIHGQDDYNKCIEYINNGFGIFTHYPKNLIYKKYYLFSVNKVNINVFKDYNHNNS